jgi:hypothetical protein
MNTSIRNILREGLILEASKKDTLINKIGWDEASANILDRLCGPLSVLIGNKIIEWKVKDYGAFPEGTSPQDIKKVIMGTLNGEQFVWRNTQNITSIMDWVRVGLNGNLGENKNLSFWDLFRASEKWHDELEVGSGDINYVEENPVILDFRDANGNGFYWADLETGSSKEECDRMGHCGTSGAGRIYSLRQVIPLNEKYKLNKSVLTAAIGTDGIVYQMKGGKNSKPEAVYHEYIYPLLFLKKGDGYFINGFGSEYESSSDFKLTDFDDDVIREIFAKRPELFNKRSLKKKLFAMGLISELPEEYVSIEISPDRVDRYIDGDYTVRKARGDVYGEGRNIGLFETILAGDTWDLWDNYDADWKGALEYHADSDSEARIREILVAMAANNGVEIDADLSLEDMIEEYDEDQEIIHAIQRAVNDSESDAYADDLYKKLKEALNELGGVEKMDDEGVVLRVNVGSYLDDLEEDVYEEISDRCNDDISCMFDEMMGEWIDKPDFRFNDNYYSPDINNEYFNETLQERLDEIRIEEINESKVMIKNMLIENFVTEARYSNDIRKFLDQDPRLMTVGTAYYISSMNDYMNKTVIDKFGKKVPNPMYDKIFKHTRFIFGWKDTYERAMKRINPDYVVGPKSGNYKPVQGYDMLESGKNGLYFPIVPTGTEYVYVICGASGCKVASKNEVKPFFKETNKSYWSAEGKAPFRQLIVDRAVKITGGGHEWVNDKIKSKWLGIGNV